VCILLVSYFALLGNVGMRILGLVLVSVYVNREGFCYFRSSEQGSPRRN